MTILVTEIVSHAKSRRMKNFLTLMLTLAFGVALAMQTPVMEPVYEQGVQFEQLYEQPAECVVVVAEVQAPAVAPSGVAVADGYLFVYVQPVSLTVLSPEADVGRYRCMSSNTLQGTTGDAHSYQHKGLYRLTDFKSIISRATRS